MRIWRIAGREGWLVALLTALTLGGGLAVGLLLLLSQVAHGLSAPFSAAVGESQSPTVVRYHRTQTVTLHSPGQSGIYATAYTTTFQVAIEDYVLGSWLVLPDDAVTHTASCVTTPPGGCDIVWGSGVVTFAGSGRGNIYLEYDTQSRAWRDPATRVLSLTYPIGPYSDEHISLTNTVLYSRTLEPPWAVLSATPTGVISEPEECVLRWIYSSTLRRVFEVRFDEPWLGSDLVIDRLEMSNPHPIPGEPVTYTVVLRNQGTEETGRAVLTELFVRPKGFGAPVVLTDHLGGWLTYDVASLFKWESATAAQMPGLPLTQRTSAGLQGSDLSETSEFYWWPGIAPGDVITGRTVLEWPSICGTVLCGVWAKVDPTYIELGQAYDWYGYNPEGFFCERDAHGLPNCLEESNNIAAYYQYRFMPSVFRIYSIGE